MPFIRPSQVGVAAGIVGAGGNVGAVIWSTMFKTIDYWPDVFMVMGCVIIFVALLTLFMTIHGARITPCCSRDDNYDADDPGLSLKTPPSLVGHSGYTPEAEKAPAGAAAKAARLEGDTLVLSPESAQSRP